MKEASAAKGPVPHLAPTKLHIPGWTHQVIPRQRLEDKLDRSAGQALTLVAAPSGYGKSTLVASWLNNRAMKAAWVSLDESDNDVIRFWHCLILSLQSVEEGYAEHILQDIHAVQHFPVEYGVAQLAELLLQREQETVIVLDDYHTIVNTAIHDTLAAFLASIQAVPSRVRLILISRSRPPIPVSRLRVREQLLELTLSDLRFQYEETDRLLNGTMKLGLSPSGLAAWLERTEGWVTGMKLAALSAGENNEPAGAVSIDSIRGNHRYMVDYLAEEVLLRQPEQVKAFLLHTSVLNRMNAELCNQLTGRRDGYELLMWLETHNLFVIPLDQQRQWYRYHALFGEFLRARQQERDPEQVKRSHAQAAVWLEKNGDDAEAVYHWLEAGSSAEAGRLIGAIAPQLLKRGESATLLGLLSRLPIPYIHAVPRLAIAYAWALLFAGRMVEAKSVLHKAELALSADKEWTEDADRVNEWGVEVALILSQCALVRKDTRKAMAYAQEAIARKARISDFMLIGIELNAYDAILIRGMLGMGGQLRKAAAFLQGIVQNIDELDVWRIVPSGYMYTALGELMYEWDELDQAESYILEGIKIAEDHCAPGMLVPGYLGLARLKLAQGKRARAIELSEELLALLADQKHQRWRSIVFAFLAEVEMKEGDREKAADWIEEFGGKLPRNSMRIREFEHLTLIRAWLLTGRWKEAEDHLDRLLHAADKEDRVMSQVNVLNLRALLLARQGREEESLSVLHQGLLLAEPHRYIRLYVDEGQEMGGLLRRLADSGHLPGERQVSLRYVRLLLDRMTGSRDSFDLAESTRPVSILTPRQWEIMKLVAQGHANGSIAERLFISEGTLKVHLNRIYKRLKVDNRNQAKQWMEQVQLLHDREPL